MRYLLILAVLANAAAYAAPTGQPEPFVFANTAKHSVAPSPRRVSAVLPDIAGSYASFYMARTTSGFAQSYDMTRLYATGDGGYTLYNFWGMKSDISAAFGEAEIDGRPAMALTIECGADAFVDAGAAYSVFVASYDDTSASPITLYPYDIVFAYDAASHEFTWPLDDSYGICFANMNSGAGYYIAKPDFRQANGWIEGLVENSRGEMKPFHCPVYGFKNAAATELSLLGILDSPELLTFTLDGAQGSATAIDQVYRYGSAGAEYVWSGALNELDVDCGVLNAIYTVDGQDMDIEFIDPYWAAWSDTRQNYCAWGTDTTIHLSFDYTTGIEDVCNDAAGSYPAEYYNLQGIRVDGPQPGRVTILRQGPTVVKVVQ